MTQREVTTKLLYKVCVITGLALAGLAHAVQLPAFSTLNVHAISAIAIGCGIPALAMWAGGYASVTTRSKALESLERMHERVERTLALSQTDAGIRRIGLPNSERIVRRSRLACAGTILAGWLALEHGVACNAAGGSHHAAADHGAGFCVFNDVAVAARNLLSQGVAGPILIVDADVHQGDGTARIFADDPAVFTLSVHAQRNFPARKARSRLDVGLDDGTGDAEYLDALAAALSRAISEAEPRLAFYNAGVDVHRDDKLGRLALTDSGLRARDALVLGALRRRRIPVVGVLGGGYSDDPVALAERHAILFEEAARLSG